MCVLIFSITFVWNISTSKKNWARMIQNIYSFPSFWITRYSCPSLMKLQLAGQIVEKY